MSIISLSILLLCLQPFVIYKVMFSSKEKSQSDLEFELSFLVIAPCFIYFYLDTFWHALLLLSSVSALGGLLAKLCEKKARYSLPLKQLYYFLIVWFFLFSIGYGGVLLWDYLTSLWTTPAVSDIAESTYSDIPEDSVMPITARSKTTLLENITPSLIYLGAIISVLLVKLYEIRSSSENEYSNNIFFILSIFPGILALFSEYYISSLVFNVYLFIQIGIIITEYDKRSDPSAGSAWFIYMFFLVGGVMASVMYKSVIWLFSF
ncbi:hypothetical protein [Colwellia sp. UCD-KL20]|uniref:hypothetical protein n=1 Tax=Colwellia sp. UCD-KL20 TaxID=1917165 RepID=UPI001178831A|nr:hypothetical protein [Colwellia sp. UCD-KL20]